jgi:hypothetical protein
MGARMKITLSVDRATAQKIAEASSRLGVSKSRFVEGAVQYWLRRELERELKEGYQAMGREDRATAEENLEVTWEILK